MANPWHWLRGIEGTGPQPVAFGAKMTKEEVEAETVTICAGYVSGPPVKLGDVGYVEFTLDNDGWGKLTPVFDDNNTVTCLVPDYSTEIKKAAQEAVAAELQRQKDEIAANHSRFEQQRQHYTELYNRVLGPSKAAKEQRILTGYDSVERYWRDLLPNLSTLPSTGTESKSSSPASVSQVSRETKKLSRETESLPPSGQALEKTREDWQKPVQVRRPTYMGMRIVVDPDMPKDSVRLACHANEARMDNVFFRKVLAFGDSAMPDENE